MVVLMVVLVILFCICVTVLVSGTNKVPMIDVAAIIDAAQSHNWYLEDMTSEYCSKGIKKVFVIDTGQVRLELCEWQNVSLAKSQFTTCIGKGMLNESVENRDEFAVVSGDVYKFWIFSNCDVLLASGNESDVNAVLKCLNLK